MTVPFSPYLSEPADVWQQLEASIRLALQVPGDLAECGVAEGHSALGILQIMKERNVAPDARLLHLFDTFNGVPENTPEAEDKCERFYPRGNPDDPNHRNFAIGVPAVRHHLRAYNGAYAIHAGPFAKTMPPFTTPLCWMFVDCNWKRSMLECFRLADHCLSVGGVMVIHDVGHPRHPGVSAALAQGLDWQRYWVIQPRKVPKTAGAGLAVAVKLC